jgi:hypothetical protein
VYFCFDDWFIHILFQQNDWMSFSMFYTCIHDRR